jgi:cell division protein FtsB
MNVVGKLKQMDLESDTEALKDKVAELSARVANAENHIRMLHRENNYLLTVVQALGCQVVQCPDGTVIAV